MTEQEPFRVRVRVRQYELDVLGHVNQAVYHQYAEVGRLGLFEEAGGANAGMHESGLAPVLLESHIAYRRELRGGDTIDITCRGRFGAGKVFWMDSEIYKIDGTLSAEITCTLGLMDLGLRKLVPGPREEFQRYGLDLAVFTQA